MLNAHSGPLQNVISKYRKRGPGAEISSSLAGKPQHIVDIVNARVEVMRIRYEQGLDLWTGEPLDKPKGSR
jgi:hypothetical protein